MTVDLICDLGDPRLDPYRNLKTARLHRRAGLFIAEGDKVVERLLASDCQIASILVSAQRSARFSRLAPPHVELLVVQDRLASQLVGFKFHAGVMACARRKPRPGFGSMASSRFLIGCSHVDDPENLGGIIRLCAVFGVEGIILGRGCADPFSRRVLRVSMGNGFCLPIYESGDLVADLSRLRTESGFQLIAAVADPDAETIEAALRPERGIVLFGNEAHGLERDLIDICNHRVTVPMRSGTDSLNVAVAAGIILYTFRPRGSHPGHEGLPQK